MVWLLHLYRALATLTGVNTALIIQVVLLQALLIKALVTVKPEVTFVFYHTRGTTTPIPASGDYKVLFAPRQVPANTTSVNCSDVMPELAVPVVSAGNTTGLGSTAPLRNKGIYLSVVIVFTLVFSLTVQILLAIPLVLTSVLKADSSKHG